MDKACTISFLQSRGVLPSSLDCKCRKAMRLSRDTSEVLHILHPATATATSTYFGCLTERSGHVSMAMTFSFFSGTWLANSNLTLAEGLKLTYMWAHHHTQEEAPHEARVGKNVTVRWYYEHREACMARLLSKDDKIGGKGQIVEIDESKFDRWKYHCGDCVDGSGVSSKCTCACMRICTHMMTHDTDSISLQVFGGIKWHGKQGAFFIVVEAHDAATLLPIIRKYIALGTIIMSDCWRAYDCLEEHGYWHLNVNHSKNSKNKTQRPMPIQTS